MRRSATSAPGALSMPDWMTRASDSSPSSRSGCSTPRARTCSTKPRSVERMLGQRQALLGLLIGRPAASSRALTFSGPILSSLSTMRSVPTMSAMPMPW